MGSDMEILKEDCYKYNEDGNEYHALACQMYDEFKHLVDSIEEPQAVNTEVTSRTRSEGRMFAAANNNVETVQTRRSLRSSLKSPPVLDAVGASSTTVQEEGHARAKSCAEIGSSRESDTDSSDGDNGHQEEESQTKVRSVRKPSAEINEQQEDEPRPTRHAATGSRSRRINLRVRRKPSDADKYYEEQLPVAATRSRRRGTTGIERETPSYAGTESEEEEHSDSSNEDENDRSTHGKKQDQEDEPRRSRRSTTQLQAKQSYEEKGSEEDEHLESSGEDESNPSDGENRGQKVEPRPARRSTRQLKATEAVAQGQKRDMSTNAEDSEGEEHFEDSSEDNRDTSDGENSGQEVETVPARRSTRELKETKDVAR